MSKLVKFILVVGVGFNAYAQERFIDENGVQYRGANDGYLRGDNGDVIRSPRAIEGTDRYRSRDGRVLRAIGSRSRSNPRKLLVKVY